jgi:hypothetical protein
MLWVSAEQPLDASNTLRFAARFQLALIIFVRRARPANESWLAEAGNAP